MATSGVNIVERNQEFTTANAVAAGLGGASIYGLGNAGNFQGDTHQS